MCRKLKNVCKFDHSCHYDLVISVCLALVPMYIWRKYEGSMISHLGRRGNYMITLLARRTVHRLHQRKLRWATTHDEQFMAFMPNEPKTYELLVSLLLVYIFSYVWTNLVCDRSEKKRCHTKSILPLDLRVMHF